jgi:hypothetical protein
MGQFLAPYLDDEMNQSFVLMRETSAFFAGLAID